MKRLIALILAMCIILSLFTACGSSTDNIDDSTDKPNTATTAPETVVPETTTPTSIDTDENLLTVDITLPASMFEGEDMSKFDPDAYATENGFIKATVNEDGTIIVTMTKARHKKLLKEMTISLEETFSEYIEGTDTPYIKEITHNDDFSSIEIKVVRADYENSWDMTSFSVGISAIIYQAFLDMDCHVEINTIDVDTGEIINTLILPMEE